MEKSDAGGPSPLPSPIQGEGHRVPALSPSSDGEERRRRPFTPLTSPIQGEGHRVPALSPSPDGEERRRRPFTPS